MEWGCMQALIDFDGWRKWKDFSAKAVDGKTETAASSLLAEPKRRKKTRTTSATGDRNSIPSKMSIAKTASPSASPTPPVARASIVAEHQDPIGGITIEGVQGNGGALIA